MKKRKIAIVYNEAEDEAIVLKIVASANDSPRATLSLKSLRFPKVKIVITSGVKYAIEKKDKITIINEKAFNSFECGNWIILILSSRNVTNGNKYRSNSSKNTIEAPKYSGFNESNSLLMIT